MHVLPAAALAIITAGDFAMDPTTASFSNGGFEVELSDAMLDAIDPPELININSDGVAIGDNGTHPHLDSGEILRIRLK